MGRFLFSLNAEMTLYWLVVYLLSFVGVEDGER